MTRRPIVFARAMLGGGLVLLSIAITAVVLQGFSDWALLIAPLAITVTGVSWTLRVKKYGSIFPTPGDAAHE
jgi:predicted RND superfamily exporter protein